MDYQAISRAVSKAETAEAALEWLADNKYNTVGPDFRVPKFDMNNIATGVPGADAARRYLNSAMLAYLPSILLTARSMCHEHLKEAQNEIREATS